MQRPIAAVLATLTFALVAHDAASQAYPARPIRIVVPATPGGAIDLAARSLGAKMTESWGQAVVIDNKGGASGILGSEIVAKAAPDGYTLLLVSSGHAINAGLFPKLPYDTLRDFTPVALTHVVPLVMVINPSVVPADSVQSFIAYAKANSGKLSYASSGNGSSLHLSAELFKTMTGVALGHIPYKGSSAAHPDLLSGQTHIIFDTVTAIAPHVKSGKLRALGVTTPKRSGVLPDVAPIAELGLPGYDTSTWGCILAPAGLPADVTAKLNAEVNRALRLPDVRERFLAAGMEPGGDSPEFLAKFMQSEIVKWSKVIKDSGAKVDQ